MLSRFKYMLWTIKDTEKKEKAVAKAVLVSLAAFGRS